MTSLNANMLVIDAGVGYALCVQDGHGSSLRARLAGHIERGDKLVAPSIWRFELTSIFTKAVHFQQLSEASARQALELSSELRVQLIHPDHELVVRAFEWTRRLKRAAAYDSFYLAMAERLGCELWTVDRRLVNAVAEPWVRHVGKID